MTKGELLKEMEGMDDDAIVICMDESGGWDNTLRVESRYKYEISIIFGGGSPFSDGG